MTAIQTHFDILVRGGSLANAFQQAQREFKSAAHSRLRLRKNWNDILPQHARGGGPVLNVSGLRSLSSEPELSNVRHHSSPSQRFLLFVDHDEMPAESIAESVVALGVRGKERLHLARLETDDATSFFRRLLAGLLASDEDASIMDVWWDDDELVVISPLFQRLRIPLVNLPKLSRVSSKDRAKFEIDPQGDFIYWPSHDIHMGWPQFQQAVDPLARLRAQQKHEHFNERYGSAIRAFRESMGLRQLSIAGMNERTVRRIEQGKTRATANALRKLANAHDMTPADYMAAVAKHMDARAS